MSEHVSYQGRCLGCFKLDNTQTKSVFVAESLDSLEALLRLNPSDVIEFESRSSMPYEQFKAEHLAKVSAFYPTMDDFLLNGHKGRTINKYQENLTK